MSGATTNFDFLEPHAPQLVRLGGLAERYFKDDSNRRSVARIEQPSVKAEMAAICLSEERMFIDLIPSVFRDQTGPLDFTAENCYI